MPEEIEALRKVVRAAEAYLAIVNNPPVASPHKAQDAERQAFMDLEDAVAVALDAIKAAKAVRDPEEAGAWS